MGNYFLDRQYVERYGRKWGKKNQGKRIKDKEKERKMPKTLRLRKEREWREELARLIEKPCTLSAFAGPLSVSLTVTLQPHGTYIRW